ncbi:MAG: PIN domain-containing protein [Anaerolineales bacterium]|nr:PIN domain-containing protein [Anaerolineales bacterium]
MKRLFLDANVIFAACYSATGHSRDLILMAVRGEIHLVASELVLEEARRNLSATSPEYLVFLNFVIDSAISEVVRPTKIEILQAAGHVALKDAPVVAAAKKAEVDLLVTLDRKHLLGKPGLDAYCGAPVVAPREAVDMLGTG